MIMDEERHLFYLNKLKKCQDNYAKTNATRTPKSAYTTKHESSYTSKEHVEPTEEELMFFYDPQK